MLKGRVSVTSCSITVILSIDNPREASWPWLFIFNGYSIHCPSSHGDKAVFSILTFIHSFTRYTDLHGFCSAAEQLCEVSSNAAVGVLPDIPQTKCECCQIYPRASAASWMRAAVPMDRKPGLDSQPCPNTVISLLQRLIRLEDWPKCQSARTMIQPRTITESAGCFWRNPTGLVSVKDTASSPVLLNAPINLERIAGVWLVAVSGGLRWRWNWWASCDRAPIAEPQWFIASAWYGYPLTSARREMAEGIHLFQFLNLVVYLNANRDFIREEED